MHSMLLFSKSNYGLPDVATLIGSDDGVGFEPALSEARMGDEASLLALIGRIYESASDPVALGDLANDLSRAFATKMTLLYIIQNPKAKSTDLLLSATPTFDDWAHSA